MYATAYAHDVQTTMRVSVPTRDALARIAQDELGGVSLDEALRIVLFEHQTATALARLAADPAASDEYRREAAAIAEADVSVEEW
jgi:hypothetical protein